MNVDANAPAIGVGSTDGTVRIHAGAAPDVAYGLATALAEAGDFAAALAVTQRGLALRPDDGRLVVRRVQVRAELGDDADAETELDRALAVASNVAETLFVRAELMYGWQIYDAAADDLERLTAQW